MKLYFLNVFIFFSFFTSSVSIADENNKTSEFDKMLYAAHPFASRSQNPFVMQELSGEAKSVNPLPANISGQKISPEIKFTRLEWNWKTLDQDCQGDCSFMVYGGLGVQGSLRSIIVGPIMPWNWKYRSGGIVAMALSRRMATLFGVIDIEPEIGLAKRFGEQTQFETWGAFFVRLKSFPWNNYIYTTAAVSTGLNFASSVSEHENQKSGRNKGSKLMHFLAPEITFALPKDHSTELVFRFHHRSGAAGIVSDALGGAHYATMGLRFRY